MNIYFFNPCRNGDIHVSRSYIKDIIKKLGNKNEYYYIQNPIYTSGVILKDLESIKTIFDINKIDQNSSITKVGEDIFINTWYGQLNMKYFKQTYSKNKADDCSFYILYEIFKDVYNYLNVEIGDFFEYIPQIEYNNLNTSKIDFFLSESKKFTKKVLVCDNPVQSGQSSNFDFEPVVSNLSEKYKDICFIRTSELDVYSDNVFSTRDIIQLNSDLNEISYLSTYCDLIVGRSSGPYTFSLVGDNINNKDKKFVAFTNNKITALGLKDGDYFCQLNWSNSYEYDNIINKIEELL
jgi:hypothetical protein